MLPGRFNRLSHHVIKDNDVEILKLNAIYGANGAGKSNLIKALILLKDFLIKGTIPLEFITETFKFDATSQSKEIYIAVEFIKEKIPYYYGITINQGIIIEEELQISGLGKREDKVLFLRTDKTDRKELDLTFSEEVLKDPEASQFPSFLKNEILERNKPVLFYMKNRQNKAFEYFKNAFEWFDINLTLIKPATRPGAMVLYLERNKSFHDFAIDIMKSFNTGVTNIYIDTIPIEDFLGEDNKHEAERMAAELKANPKGANFLSNSYEDVAIVLENNKPVAKRIVFSHSEDLGNARFELSEESDGTRRLLEYLPALFGVVSKCKTYFIDEIERSLHPLLVKELIKKFSHDPQTKGQLIFSTHESNLLDQEIFRPDEIWFAEKNKQGATELYALSEFKEHHTLNIRNGYLNGRYGGIPFLGNLKDLNWDKYAEAI